MLPDQKNYSAKVIHPISSKLLSIMQEKESNLVFSADITDAEKFLAMVKIVAPEICMLKTHIDIVSPFSEAFIKRLQSLAHEYNFLLFEDRKYADIGNTVKWQYCDGMYRVREWADIVNAHIVSGPGILDALREAIQERPDLERGVLVLAEMSSAGNMMDAKYAEAALQMARDYSDVVMGFICQHRLGTKEDCFFHLTPGVKIGKTVGNLGQKYRSPHDAMVKDGCDLIIVGSGIYKAEDPLAAAKMYRRAAWQAYRERT